MCEGSGVILPKDDWMAFALQGILPDFFGMWTK